MRVCYTKLINMNVQNVTCVGIPIVLPDKSKADCHAILLCTTCDLPARAMILNMVNFNGFYSCCFCLQPGILLFQK